MAGKGDKDFRVKDRKTYGDNLDKIRAAPSEGYCEHHVHRAMTCSKCEDKKNER